VGGVQAQWMDAFGSPTSRSVLTYHQSTGTVTHSGWMRLAIWDDLAAQGYPSQCGFSSILGSSDGIGGHLLCNGTTYYETALLPEADADVSGDLVAQAFLRAVGDTLPNACAATNFHGTTLPSTITYWVTTFGHSPLGYLHEDLLANNEPLTIDVTLVCQ
jgi:hypothetical protein